MSKAAKLLNQQYNNELTASYRYLTMSYTLEQLELHGMAKWMYGQHQDELGHAKRIYDYMVKTDLPMSFAPIHMEDDKCKTALDIFKKGLDSEIGVTTDIYKIMDEAIKEKHYGIQLFLQWFIDEQEEEEETMMEFVKTLEIIGNSRSGLFALDARAGETAESVHND